MNEPEAERREMMRTKTLEKSLPTVQTGEGEGKSSADFGMGARSSRWGVEF